MEARKTERINSGLGFLMASPQRHLMYLAHRNRHSPLLPLPLALPVCPFLPPNSLPSIFMPYGGGVEWCVAEKRDVWDLFLVLGVHGGGGVDGKRKPSKDSHA